MQESYITVAKSQLEDRQDTVGISECILVCKHNLSDILYNCMEIITACSGIGIVHDRTVSFEHLGFYGRRMEYIFSSCGFFLSIFFPRLISAAADWMSTILRRVVWP